MSSKDNLYTLARRAYSDKDYAMAEEYYQDILLDNPDDWEATLYSALAGAYGYNLLNFESATRKVQNASRNVLKSLSNSLKDVELHKQAAKICNDVNCTLMEFQLKALQHYGQFSSLSSAKSEYTSRLNNITFAYLQWGDAFANYCNGKSRKLCGEMYNQAYKAQIEVIKELKFQRIPASVFALFSTASQNMSNIFPDFEDPLRKLDERFAEIDRQYGSASTANGCYVATAVYGSYDCPEVWTLRRFRDNTLAESIFGRAFIHTYYAISPTLVKWFGETQWFKNLFKGKLDKMVKNLNNQGVENTPYEDKSWK